MTEQGHPLDQLLRSISGDPVPTEAEFNHGRVLLQRAITLEPSATEHRRRASRIRGRRIVAVAGVAAILAVIAIGASLLQTPPVTALGDLAAVAERLEAPSPSDGEYLFSRSTERTLNVLPAAVLGLDREGDVAYLVLQEIDTYMSDTERIEIVTTREPEFFDDEVAAAYRIAGLRTQDGIGRTDTFVFEATAQVIDLRNWPTDPDNLAVAMREFVSGSGDDRPEDVQLVELAGNLLRQSTAEPELRAAVLRVLATLDVDVAQTPDASLVTVSVTYTDTIKRTVALVLDVNSNLVREFEVWPDGNTALGVPPGTAISKSEYTPPRIVTGAIPGR